MSTTSLKLPEELKQRAVKIAKKQGISPHAFMIKAIEAVSIAAEHHAGFVEDAEAALNTMRKTGKGYDADDLHTYLKKRVAGKKSAIPRVKDWRN